MGGRLVALLGPLGEQPGHDVLHRIEQLRRLEVGPDVVKPLGAFLLVRLEVALVGLGLEGHVASDRLEQCDTEAVEVGALGAEAEPVKLLGGHVGPASRGEHRHLREVPVRDAREPECGPLVALRGLAGAQGQQLHRPRSELADREQGLQLVHVDAPVVREEEGVLRVPVELAV